MTVQTPSQTHASSLLIIISDAVKLHSVHSSQQLQCTCLVKRSRN